jgi:hypothetical protein
MNTSNLRILIVPNLSNSYDIRMVNGLAEGFNQLGCFARAIKGSISDHGLSQLCKNLSINVVIQINKSRPLNTELSKNVRWISWYQDIFPKDLESFGQGFKQDDIIYTLGEPEALGLEENNPFFRGALFTGVGASTLNYRPVSTALKDFSLCGYIPAPPVLKKDLRTDLLWYLNMQLKKVPLLSRSNIYLVTLYLLFKKKLPLNYIPYSAQHEIKLIVDTIYRPLRGELDINELSGAMGDIQNLFSLKKRKKNNIKPNGERTKINLFSKIVQPYGKIKNGGINSAVLIRKALNLSNSLSELSEYSGMENALNYFCQTYPRLIDRKFFIQNILEVSKSLELYGPGWESHPEFAPYHKGFVENESDLLNVYCNSRINLANNTHGLGMHSRTLECMAVGGFIFTHKSANDFLSSGMSQFFEPDIDYGVFEPENLKDRAAFWLRNASLRAKAATSAARKIREKHTWRHRASQIIKDLEVQ